MPAYHPGDYPVNLGTLAVQGMGTKPLARIRTFKKKQRKSVIGLTRMTSRLLRACANSSNLAAGCTGQKANTTVKRGKVSGIPD